MAVHPHGSLYRYKLGGCRCRPCKDAKAAYSRHRHRMIAYGRWQSYVDAEPCRGHVRSLMASGVTLGRVAVLAGLGVATLQKLMDGTPRSGGVPSSRVRPKTAESILAVRLNLDDLPGTAWVNATGSKRRIQALAALGYTLKEQAEAVGKIPSNYRAILFRDTVLAGTARYVRDLYKAWSMTPAPQTWVSERTRRIAEKNGWCPPLAWDDDLIDLADADLEKELADRVSLMGHRELQRCNDAHYRLGDGSPLVVAAAREYERRKKRRTLREAS